ncbi:MAG TPA: type II toxin-antitoxin system VapC family toxin [Thermoanaerobaculia bacterium]|nr:type II toxin-antitoxin system VapC family toxin [Thermoanaerobaculia bacterium]
MTVLLDTHALIWLAEGLEELPARSRRLLDAAARTEGLAVSPITFWEVAMLESRRRVSLSHPVEQWREAVLAPSQIQEAELDGAIAIESVGLPGDFHEDPADRILVATARLRGWKLATRDSRILDYGAAGYVDVLRV